MAKRNNLYLIQAGFKNIFANSLMSLSSLSVLFACLLLVGGAFLLYFNIQKGIEYVGGMSEIVLFVEDDISEYNCRQIIQPKLENMTELHDITFISSSEGLEQLQEQIQGGKELFELFEGDTILPHSFRVKVKSSHDYDYMVTTLGKMEGIQEVLANGQVAGTLTSIAKSVAIFAIVMVVILLTVSVFILNNTIKLAMFTRRKEIYIMKMVGATNSFVRIPFLIEGVAIGFAAAVLSFFALWFAYSGLSSYIVELGINAVPWKSIGLQILGTFVGAGLTIGLFTSTIAIKRYLKV